VPIALNSGLFWPRRSLMRFPGTIVVEVLEPIPPGLARAEFRRLLENRIEAASAALVREAALPGAPPTVADALSRLDTRAGLNEEL
jgi:1-acyl-sn-glycerol-3-phosphate acyltransferase